MDLPGDAVNKELCMLNPQNPSVTWPEKDAKNYYYVSTVSKSSATRDILIQYVYCANKDCCCCCFFVFFK